MRRFLAYWGMFYLTCPLFALIYSVVFSIVMAWRQHNPFLAVASVVFLGVGLVVLTPAFWFLNRIRRARA